MDNTRGEKREATKGFVGCSDFPDPISDELLQVMKQNGATLEKYLLTKKSSLLILLCMTVKEILLKNGNQLGGAMKYIRPPTPFHTGTTVPASPALFALSCNSETVSCCSEAGFIPNEWPS